MASTTSTPPAFSPRAARALAGVLGVGALVKIAFLVVHQAAPDFAHPCLDALYHDFLARGFAFGTWVVPAGVPDPHLDTTPLARPPLYPLLLALLYKLSGGSLVFVRGVHLVGGLVAAYLAACLARRLTPHDAIAPAAAAAFVVLSPTLLYFEGELVAASPAAVVVIGLVLLLCRLRDRLTVPRAIASGVAIGALGLLRPNYLLLAPVAAAFVSVDTWLPRLKTAMPKADASTTRRALIATAAMTIAALAITLPVTARNASKSGEAIFISTNGGLTLLHGNHAGADGVTMSLPLEGPLQGVQEVSPFAYHRLVDVVAKATGDAPSFARTEAWFRRQATTWMTTHFSDFLALTAKKTLLFWGPREVSNNKQVALERDANVVTRSLPARWPILLLFAAIGLAAGWRRTRAPSTSPPPADDVQPTPSPAPKKGRKSKRKNGTTAIASDAQAKVQERVAHKPEDDESRRIEAHWLSFAFIVVAFLSVVIFLAASRFRAPLVPLLAAFAGVGMSTSVQALRTKSVDGVVLAAAAVAIFFGAINWTDYAPDAVQWHQDRARAYIAAEAIDRATAELEAARAIAPNQPDVLVALGVIAGNQGRLQDAHDAFAAAASAAPSHLQAQAQLGAAKLGLNDPAGALAAFDVVLRSTEGDAALHHNRGMALGRLGRHAEARAEFERALAIRPDFAPARAILERLQ